MKMYKRVSSPKNLNSVDIMRVSNYWGCGHCGIINVDILDDMGESKLSAKVFLRVNYSFKST